MKTKLPLLAGIILLMHVQLHAQTTPKLQDPTNSFITNKALDIDAGGGVIYFKDHELLQGQLFTQYFSNTGLSIYDSMHLVKTIHDSILADENSPAPNLSHNLYQQYYKDIPVEGAFYSEHYEEDGNVLYTNGFVIENLNINTTPQIDMLTALNYAKAYINAETYQSDSTGEEPIGNLIIASTNQNNPVMSAEQYKLAWEFRIVSIAPYADRNIRVDAINGDIISESSNMFFDGDFNHIYYGTKGDLDTHRSPGNWFTSDKWYLHANDNTRNILTQDDDNGGILFHTKYHTTDYAYQPWNWDDMTYSDGDDHWGNDHWSATSAHYCAQKTWDFYKQTTLNRNGMTGWGKHVRVIGDFPLASGVGAGYIQDPSSFEDHILVGKLGNNYMATYDVIGHEFTHGVIKNSYPLDDGKIAGALGESFGDMFGFMVERYMFGYVRNWTIGEDASSAVRNMQTPGVYGHPSYYLEANKWYDLSNCTANLSNDKCGVHINCGVPNKWFYFLSMGGSQPIYINNVLQPTRALSGIGIDKAARIAYYTIVNNTNYNKANLTFDVVRANSIAAARILYGYCSNEYIQTCLAWYAVNVGASCTPCPITVNWFSRNFPNQQPNYFNGTSIQERENGIANMVVFPNPANDKIKIILEETNVDLSERDYTINILTMDGKMVSTAHYNNLSNEEIDITQLKSGVYFVNIMTPSWTKNCKFVKQ